MLSIRSAGKQYGKVRALDDVSFDLEDGRVLAIVGANGAGKSTLIKIIAGLMRFEGDVAVDGVDVRRHGKAARRHIGYLAQHPAFHLDMTVQETVQFFSQLRGAEAGEARSAVLAVGLEPHATKLVGALSGGMRQRLGLAVAQLGSPSLFVLDEPGTGLDVSARLELRDFIRAQRSAGKSVLLSTHWLEDVPSTADDVLVLDQGRVVFHGPSVEFAAASTARSRLFLRLNGHTPDAIPLVADAARGEVTQTGEWISVTCLTSDKVRVLEALVAAGIGLLDFRVEEATAATAPPVLRERVPS